jgi:hypothetical protein
MPDDFLEHIPHVRLLCVAVADNLHFNEDELEHIKTCTTCYDQWKQFLTTIGGNRPPRLE